MAELKVEKKGGRVENFQRAKVEGGILKSGASQEQAEDIASKVEAWARENAANEVIKTSNIRIRVLELLREVNPKAAGAFEAYRKPGK